MMIGRLADPGILVDHDACKAPDLGLLDAKVLDTVALADSTAGQARRARHRDLPVGVN